MLNKDSNISNCLQEHTPTSDINVNKTHNKQLSEQTFDTSAKMKELRQLEQKLKKKEEQ